MQSIISNMSVVANKDVFMKKPILQIGQWSFSPGILSSLSTLLLLLLFVQLGFWQLSRSNEKLMKQKELENRIKQPGLTLTSNLQTKLIDPKKFKDFRYQQLEVKGQFLQQNHILLDNQIFKGQAGYRVITPLLLHANSQLILVDRGWIPLLNGRQTLPNLNTVKGTLILKGRLNQIPHGIQLKKIPLSPLSLQWPLIIQQLDFKALSNLLGFEIYPFVLQLETNDPHSFNVLPFSFGLSATRHLGYAIQWFTMAIASLIYYVVINCYRLKHA